MTETRRRNNIVPLRDNKDASNQLRKQACMAPSKAHTHTPAQLVDRIDKILGRQQATSNWNNLDKAVRSLWLDCKTSPHRFVWRLTGVVRQEERAKFYTQLITKTILWRPPPTKRCFLKIEIAFSAGNYTLLTDLTALDTFLPVRYHQQTKTVCFHR